MPRFFPSARPVGRGLLLALFLILAACGREETAAPAPARIARGGPHPILGRAASLVLDGAAEQASGEPSASAIAPFLVGASTRPRDPIDVDDPLDGSIFPPAFTPPTVLWHDANAQADTWLVEVTFVPAAPSLQVLLPGWPASRGTPDPQAMGETNAPYVPSAEQASARSWTPTDSVWRTIQARSLGGSARLVFTGFGADRPGRALSRGEVRIHTSTDELTAPIFYRDVPLMPAVGEAGRIQPLAAKALPTIGWRLRDVARPESRLLLTGMPSCANCHSFSQDGKTLAMDIDGPQGDKGAYAVAPITKHLTIGKENVLTWNSFADKPEGHRTIGFLSRVSPDGQNVLSTVNESLYVANFTNYRFLQVFFPTRGILAWWSRATDTIRALPGADDVQYVHCDPVWSPDGETVVFARAPAQDPYVEGRPLATHPNDPNEPQIRYDLYRMPFGEGQGGRPLPIAGASNNGMSNTFPKVSPDGKWIVFVKCKNGQLMRPDGRLWIVPFEGGEAREMRCNTELMNSWHSFSPNSRWMVFSSKINTPYTQLFLTHIDADGNDSPPVLVPNSTAVNRAANIPEFVNIAYDDLQEIEVPAAQHHVHYQRGQRALDEGDMESAVGHFVQALEQEPEFSQAHASLGHAYTALEKLDEARRHYQQALEVDARNVVVLSNLGLLTYRQGDEKKALAFWERALAISPMDPMVNSNLGLVRARAGDYAAARRHFEAALESDPAFTVAYKNLAMIALDEGDAAEALERIDQGLESDPNDPWLRTQAVELLAASGRLTEARPHLEALVVAGPQDAGARMSLAWLLATSPDTSPEDAQRAVELAEDACRLTGYASPPALDALGAAYAGVGRFDDAVRAAEKAVRAAEANDPGLAQMIRQRLERYRRRVPYRADDR